MEMPPEKSETIVFLGKDPVGYKFVVDNKCLQKVQYFKYFGYEVSYENGKDIQQKLAKFAQILVIQNNTLTPTLKQKFSMMKAYNPLALSILLYGSEIWTLKKKNKNLLK
jgi:hypothetical protein